jgi:2,3-bisphosphoglycerate-independent phosphoglycerate mutase
MPPSIKRPALLVVRDGWGANPYPEWNHANAVYLARKPVDDRLMASYPHVQIHTSGEDVGLPAGVMGNSEVGHQNIGAGRIVDQEIMRITRSIRDGAFFENPVLREGLSAAKSRGGGVHIMGLCSDAGVHSVLEHADALLEACRRAGVPGDRVFFHAFGDGRDSPPESGKDYITAVEREMVRVGVGRVATVCGRYYAMDRDDRWDRVEKAYRLLTEGKGHRVRSAVEAFTRYYAKPTDSSRHGDEFIEPTVVLGPDGNAPPVIRDGDAVIFFNFRGDRPRELTKAFTLESFPFRAAGRDGVERELGFPRVRKPDLFFVTMTEYEEGLPVRVLFRKPEKMRNILGAFLSERGVRQFRIAETEKYAHVTFFFNDYRDEPFPGEMHFMAPSPRDVSTYDQKPEMSARAITDELLKRLAQDAFDVCVINYANGDMVGHTGVLEAAIRAVETVDGCVGRIVDATLARGGCAIVTADHGNCEQMIDPATGKPHTAHTTYDVELIVVDDARSGRSLRTGGRLADIAPTLLEMMGSYD